MKCWSKVGQTARRSDEAWLATKKKKRAQACQKIFLSLWEDDVDRVTQSAAMQGHVIYLEHRKCPQFSLAVYYMRVIIDKI